MAAAGRVPGGAGSGARSALIVLTAGAAVVAATGIVARHAFTEPDTLKYLVTVLAPLVIVAGCLVADPVRLFSGAAILVAPFGFVATFAGVALTPVAALLVLAAAAAAFQPSPARGPTATGTVVVIALALLLPALALGTAFAHELTWLGLTLIAGYLAFRIGSQDGGLRFLLSLVVISATVQGLLAVYEFSQQSNLDLYSAHVEQAVGQNAFFSLGRTFRPSGTLPDPIALGNFLALACPLALGLSVDAGSRWRRSAWILAGGVIAVGLTVSFSRMSWIAAVAGVLVAVIALPSRRRLMAAAGVASVGATVIVIGLSIGGTDLNARLNSISDPTSRVNRTYQGDREREQIWSAAETVVRQHPVAGTGLGKLEPALGEHLAGAPAGLHAHSVYLQFLAEAGIAGLLALLLIVGHAAVSFVVALGRRERILLAGALGALAAILVTWLTDTSVRYVELSVPVAFVLGAGIAQRWRTDTPVQDRGRQTSASVASIMASTE